MSSEAHASVDGGYASAEPPSVVVPKMPTIQSQQMPQQLAGLLNLVVNNPAGKVVGRFTVDSLATVQELKAQLVSLCNVDARRQILLHEKVRLQDNDWWIHTCVKDNDELTLVLVTKAPLLDETIKQAVECFCDEGVAKDEIERNCGHISQWDTSNVTDMTRLFSGLDKFNEDLSAWDVSKVHTMRSMFYGAESFNCDLNAWSVSNVTDMNSMFQKARWFNGDLTAWRVGSVRTMEGMFCGAESFNGDLSAWNVKSVTDMSSMFRETECFNGDLSAWSISDVTDLSYMFYEAESFNGDLSTWNVSPRTNTLSMFSGAPIRRRRKPKTLQDA